MLPSECLISICWMHWNRLRFQICYARSSRVANSPPTWCTRILQPSAMNESSRSPHQYGQRFLNPPRWVRSSSGNRWISSIKRSREVQSIRLQFFKRVRTISQHRTVGAPTYKPKVNASPSLMLLDYRVYRSARFVATRKLKNQNPIRMMRFVDLKKSKLRFVSTMRNRFKMFFWIRIPAYIVVVRALGSRSFDSLSVQAHFKTQ